MSARRSRTTTTNCSTRSWSAPCRHCRARLCSDSRPLHARLVDRAWCPPQVEPQDRLPGRGARIRGESRRTTSCDGAPASRPCDALAQPHRGVTPVRCRPPKLRACGRWQVIRRVFFTTRGIHPVPPPARPPLCPPPRPPTRLCAPLLRRPPARRTRARPPAPARPPALPRARIQLCRALPTPGYYVNTEHDAPELMEVGECALKLHAWHATGSSTTPPCGCTLRAVGGRPFAAQAPPEQIMYDRLVRNILVDKPRCAPHPSTALLPALPVRGASEITRRRHAWHACLAR